MLKKARGLKALQERGLLDDGYLNLDSKTGQEMLQAVRGGGIMTAINQDAPGRSILLMGNEAIARGAIEAGVRVVRLLPGQPLLGDNRLPGQGGPRSWVSTWSGR